MNELSTMVIVGMATCLIGCASVNDCRPFCTGIPDADGDGLMDKPEGEIGTNPFNPDTDGDGVNDGDEVIVFKTNPLDKNSQPTKEDIEKEQKKRSKNDEEVKQKLIEQSKAPYSEFRGGTPQG